jgi:hypothetical protein
LIELEHKEKIMKKLCMLFLLVAWAACIPSALADTAWACTGWNFQFSGAANPGVGPDPSNCVLQSGGNFSDINPLAGTIGTLTTDPEEDGESVTMVFNTLLGTFNVTDADGDFQLPSTITSFSFDGVTDTINMSFTVNGGTPFGGDTGTSQVFLASPTAVPEPGSIALLATVLYGLAGAFRRRVSK